ncbi:MAG: glycerol-3-phosphate acyltransferase, partial [bacterium]|nr:glycerol-3-phosphate acyltransferase [bacterium]
FNGGKGVATAIGSLLGLHFIIGVMVIATWLLIAKFSRYSSLASMISITLAPLYSLLIIPQLEIFPPLMFMVILVIFKHKNNLTRLIDGVEPKITFKNSVIEEIMESSPNIIENAHEQIIVLSDQPLTVEKNTPKVKKSSTIKKKKIIEPKAKEVKPIKKPAKKSEPKKKDDIKKPAKKTSDTKAIKKKTSSPQKTKDK